MIYTKININIIVIIFIIIIALSFRALAGSEKIAGSQLWNCLVHVTEHTA